VKPLSYPLLADENIHPRVVESLRDQGKDVVTVVDAGLGGKADADVLSFAVAQGRVVLTHDSDFGALAVRAASQFPGIVYLRPAQCDPAVVLQSLNAIEAAVELVAAGFVIVAEHRGEQVRIRHRTAP
jgi:predicted nuclease of predicted toxin-antitoxin system